MKQANLSTKVITILIAVLFIFSCSADKNKVYKEIDESNFTSQELIEFIPSNSKLLLNVRNFIVKDNYLIIANRKKENIFSVIDINNFEIVKQWGNRGKGPGEHGLFIHLINQPSDKFIIADFSRLSLKSNSTSSFEPIREVPILNNRYEPQMSEIPQTIIQIADSDYVYDKFEHHELEIARWKYGSSPSLVYKFEDLKEDFKDKSGQVLSGKLSYDRINKRIVFAYTFIRRFDIISLDGNLLKSIELKPSSNGPLFSEEGIDFKNSIRYYTDVVVDENSIFLYYVGYSFDDIENLRSNKNDTYNTFIEEYDLEGNPKRRYPIKRVLSNIEIWKKNNSKYFIGLDEALDQPFVILGPK